MKLLVLYNDGVDIWDIREIALIGQMKSIKDMPRVEDADWAASDKPVLATSDGCLRIMDLSLSGTSSPITERECFGSFHVFLYSLIILLRLLKHFFSSQPLFGVLLYCLQQCISELSSCTQIPSVVH